MRDEKLKVLRALKPIDASNAGAVTVRGQYRAGAVGRRPGAGLSRARSRTATSTTETFVALKAEIGNWRWAGVPFYLRTGKRLRGARLGDRRRLQARSRTRSSTPSAGAIEQNQLVIRLQPDEGVKLWLMIKDPGPGGMRLRYVPLDMSFAEAFRRAQPRRL